MDTRNLSISPVQEIMGLALLFLLVALIGIFIRGEGEWKIAEYTVYLVILRRSTALFGVFTSLHSSLASIAGPVDELVEIFSDNEKFQVPSGDEKFTGLKNGIRVENLNFSYREGPMVLRDCSLFVPKGKMTALVGSSGAGKSTLLHLLMRYYDCPPNAIFVDDTDIRSFETRSWRSKIAHVSQQPYLFDGSLYENIVYGLHDGSVSDAALQEVMKKAHLLELAEGLAEGLDTVIGENGVQLSGGERQRVSIARAFLKEPEILFLDEATSALDSQTERAIQEALGELLQNRSSIVIAHRLSTIESADQVLVMEKGTVVEQGSFQELIELKGVFFKFWDQQRFTSIA